MTDQVDELPAPVIETVNSAHILGSVSASVATDGQTGMLVFWVAAEEGQSGAEQKDGMGWVRKFALTLPIDKFDALRRFVHVLMRGMLVGSINQQGGEEWLTASCEEPNCTVLVTDPGRPEQLHHAMSHLTAAKVADLLQQRALPLLNAEQRQELKTWRSMVAQPQQQIITPDGKAFNVIAGSSIH